MAVKTFSTGEVLTASDTNTYLANSGLVYVTTATVGSAVTSVTINNCFTSTYDAYRIVMTNIDGTTDGNVIALQMTTSGTASTTDYAGNTFYVSTGTTGGLSNAALSAYFEAGSISNASTFSAALDLLQPALAKYTRIQWGPSVDETYFRFGGGVHKVETAYDGMKITSVVGTITGGTITVYGYRKA